jgi:hypothetical protein
VRVEWVEVEQSPFERDANVALRLAAANAFALSIAGETLVMRQDAASTKTRSILPLPRPTAA